MVTRLEPACGAPSPGSRPAGTSVIADRERRIGANARSTRIDRADRSTPAAALPQPTTGRRCWRRGVGGGAGRCRNTCPRSTLTRPVVGRRRGRSIRSVRRGSTDKRRRGPAERRHGPDHHAASLRRGRCERLQPQAREVARSLAGSRWRAAKARCRRSGWAPSRPPRSGPDPSCRAGCRAGRRGPARHSHRGGRTGCGPRQSSGASTRCGTAANAPWPQPTMPSLISNRRRIDAARPSRPRRARRVYRASGWPTGMTQPIGRSAGRPSTRVAPGIAEVGDHQVADRPDRLQVDVDLPVEQQPAAPGAGAGEPERQPPQRA